MAGHSTYAWGDNSNHQLSVDNAGDSSVPIELSRSLEELETHDVFYGSSLNEHIGSTITWYTDYAYTILLDEKIMPG